jgi:hypothetical protein
MAIAEIKQNQDCVQEDTRKYEEGKKNESVEKKERA